MSVYAIAVISDGKTNTGLRLLDNAKLEMKDFPIQDVIMGLQFGAISVENLTMQELQDDTFMENRYPIIVPNIGTIGKSPLTVMKKFENGDFWVANGMGQCVRMTVENVIKYAGYEGITNGVIVENKYVRSLRGEFEKERVVSSEQMLKNLEKKQQMTINEVAPISIIDGVLKIKNIEIQKLAIPQGLHTLHTTDLRGCHKLAEIILPKSLRVIEYMALSHCHKLKSLKLNDGFEIITEYTVSNSHVETLYIPNSIKEIHARAFLGNNSIKEIRFSNRALREKIRVKMNVRRTLI